jgi:hypothetical protein
MALRDSPLRVTWGQQLKDRPETSTIFSASPRLDIGEETREREYRTVGGCPLGRPTVVTERAKTRE